MATECSARRPAIVEADEATLAWIAARAAGRRRRRAARAAWSRPTPGAVYAGGVHAIDLAAIRPMVAHPGRPGPRHPVRPHQRRAESTRSARCAIDIAYGGSLHRGQGATTSTSTRAVMTEARRRRPPACADGVRLLHPVRLARRSRTTRARTGYLDVFERAGVEVIHARLRRLHRLRPGRLRRARPGHRLRDQPQLPGPLRAREALPRLAAHRRRLRGRGPDRRLREGHVRPPGTVDVVP